MRPPTLALDIGTSTIKALAAEFSPKGWRVLQPGQCQSRGVKYGTIVDSKDVAEQVDSLIEKMEGVLNNVGFRNAITGIAGPHLEMRSSKGIAIVSRPDEEITLDDKERANKAAAALAPQRNRTLVQSVIKNYIIDGTTMVQDPIGMKGVRLEVEAFLIDTFNPALRKIDHLGEMIGLDLNPRFVLPLAEAEVALTSQDKDLGAVMIDLGAGTTSMCVYENNELLDLKVFPVGGMNITNDIAVGLQTYVDIAEKIKIDEGVARAKKVSRGETIDLSQYWEESETGEERKVNKKLLAEIIEARLNETLNLVAQRLKDIDRFGKLPGGVILSGGGAKMTHINDLARSKFKLPVRIAHPQLDWYQDNPDPSYIALLGLLQVAYSDYWEGGNESDFWIRLTNFFKRKFSF